MNKYVVVHEHRHGISTYVVESENTPTERQVVRCLDLDYEPDSQGESLTIDVLVPGQEIKLLDDKDGDAEDFTEGDRFDKDLDRWVNEDGE